VSLGVLVPLWRIFFSTALSGLNSCKRLNAMQVSVKRKYIFPLITICIPILFFVILEMGLRLFNYGNNLDLFISAGGEYSEYYKCNPIVGRRFFHSKYSIPNPANDLFLKEKPKNCYRIFVIGGSTAAGYPFGANLMFSRILNKSLSATFPDKTIEVINTAMSAINSYTLLDFTDEIIKQSPDAVLIYAGHNEFYGALGVASTESLGKYQSVKKLYLGLQKYSTFQLIRDIVVTLKSKISSNQKGINSSTTLMERLVREQSIPYGSDIYNLGVKQFEGNIRDIVDKFHKKGVRILLSELVSNVHDLPPFKSIKTDKFPRANDVFKQAISLEKQYKMIEAKSHFYQAKDLDALRFRASEDFNAVIHSIAKEFDVVVVPMKKYFEKNSINGMIGKRLMLEHLHPTINGYFLMAQAFYETMKAKKNISNKWELLGKKNVVSTLRSIMYTEIDSIYGNLRIQILKGGWPFKPKTAPNRALQNFKPTTLLDTLAVKVWVDNSFNLERAHHQLAEYYEKQARYDLAFKEYSALMNLTPYNVSPYLKTAEALIKMTHYQSAVIVLRQSLEIKETAYAYKWIGSILLQQNKAKQAIPYFKKAKQSQDQDAQLTYNLSVAYFLNQNFKQARNELNNLQQLAPDFPDPMNFKSKITAVPN
jgi:tetratricopeptide (TPR) repeat protein